MKELSDTTFISSSFNIFYRCHSLIMDFFINHGVYLLHIYYILQFFLIFFKNNILT